MKKYKCTFTLELQEYDDDCFIVENSFKRIEVGEIWSVDELKYRLVGGKESVRLTRGLEWIEICQKTLAAYFEPAEDVTA